MVIVPFNRNTGGTFAPHHHGHVALSLEERLAEAVGLARAIDLDVCFQGTIPLSQPKPATLIGSGKVEDIKAHIIAHEVELVIVDHALTPVQQRNLELAWDAKVLDRTGLILEIFADRAQSKEGRLQVELAHLINQKSRLVRSWTHLSRQRGGFGFLGGPGETQIEADRRAISERIDVIRADLAVIERTRRLHRKRRQNSRHPIVALVGYTNAGKSTLFNALSGADVFAQDMLFATLDPTLRRVKFPQAQTSGFILSDTVGFISELPTQLIAAFRSTLEETVEADLILHVRDIASPSSAAQAIEVEKILRELGLETSNDAESKVIEVWNKADLLSDEERAVLKTRAAQHKKPCLLISAQTGQGIDDLLGSIHGRVSKAQTTRTVVVAPSDGALVHWLYQNTEVLTRDVSEDGTIYFQVRVPVVLEKALDGKLQALS